MIAEKVAFINKNLIVPNAGDNVILNINECFKVIDVWEDDYYFIPKVCSLIQEEHYDKVMNFLNEKPEFDQFLDIDTRPYKRCDHVVGPAIATAIIYVDSKTGTETFVGFDDYPVICLNINSHLYEMDCENWKGDQNG